MRARRPRPYDVSEREITFAKNFTHPIKLYMLTIFASYYRIYKYLIEN